MPRYFTLPEAERLLPQVEQAVREAVSSKAEFERAETEWQNFCSRVTLLGGVRVDHSNLTDLKRRRESSAARLKKAVETIQDFGCLLKDLDVGLIDFPTLYRGQEVYLCWKLGESGIQFWHGVQEGFAGRKAIDQEFLAQHRGGE